MPPVHSGLKAFSLFIESLACGGRGVGRADGKVCFVPYACPGDEVLVAVTVERRSYLEASILEIIKPSEHRCEPFCRYFGLCGGCSWQHVSHEAQLSAKKDILASQLSRGAGVENCRIRQTLPSPEWLAYRSRAQLKLHHDGQKAHIGFFRHGSHFVVDLPDGCPLLRPEINRFMAGLRDVLREFQDPGALPQVSVEHGDNGLFAIFHYIGQKTDDFERFAVSSALALSLDGVMLQHGNKNTLKLIAGKDRIDYGIPEFNSGSPVPLAYFAGSFAQVNRLQNRKLIELAGRMANGFLGCDLLDVYCGNGNLSLPFAETARTITGIEESPLSIDAARYNARRLHCENTEFICGNAETELLLLRRAGRVFDTLLLDPPRTGAGEIARAVASADVKQIVYVSCDPATLARDCGIMRGGGFRVAESIPVDMFPHTHHVESITLLVNQG